MSSTLNIQLTDQLRRYIDQRTSDDDVYSTPSEFLRDLVRRDMEQRRMAYDKALVQMLVDARQSEMTPMEDDFFDTMRKGIKKRPNAKNLKKK